MITKKQASLLFGYGYRLVDKEGKEFEIKGIEVHDSRTFTITLWQPKLFYSMSISPKEVGKKYWLLARPLSDLVKEIENEGERFVPIDKLNEINGTIAAYSHQYSIKQLPAWMVEKLHDWQFKPYDIPESMCREIKNTD